jgi:hypothetical protein
VDRHEAVTRALRDAVLTSSGELDPATREAIADRRDVPAELAAYVDKVHRHAYTVSDEDVQALREAGYSEDAIFEATVSAALGAGLARLDAGLRAAR